MTIFTITLPWRISPSKKANDLALFWPQIRPRVRQTLKGGETGNYQPPSDLRSIQETIIRSNFVWQCHASTQTYINLFYKRGLGVKKMVQGSNDFGWGSKKLVIGLTISVGVNQAHIVYIQYLAGQLHFFILASTLCQCLQHCLCISYGQINRQTSIFYNSILWMYLIFTFWKWIPHLFNSFK